MGANFVYEMLSLLVYLLSLRSGVPLLGAKPYYSEAPSPPPRGRRAPLGFPLSAYGKNLVLHLIAAL